MTRRLCRPCTVAPSCSVWNQTATTFRTCTSRKARESLHENLRFSGKVIDAVALETITENLGATICEALIQFLKHRNETSSFRPVDCVGGDSLHYANPSRWNCNIYSRISVAHSDGTSGWLMKELSRQMNCNCSRTSQAGTRRDEVSFTEIFHVDNQRILISLIVEVKLIEAQVHPPDILLSQAPLPTYANHRQSFHDDGKY